MPGPPLAKGGRVFSHREHGGGTCACTPREPRRCGGVEYDRQINRLEVEIDETCRRIDRRRLCSSNGHPISNVGNHRQVALPEPSTVPQHGGNGLLSSETLAASNGAAHGKKLANVVHSAFRAKDRINSWNDITGYNNFYEFGVDKDDALTKSGKFVTSPWKVGIEGECEKPGVMDLEDILKGETLEERVYRHRCVEGWSLVIPWVGRL